MGFFVVHNSIPGTGERWTGGVLVGRSIFGPRWHFVHCRAAWADEEEEKLARLHRSRRALGPPFCGPSTRSVI